MTPDMESLPEVLSFEICNGSRSYLCKAIVWNSKPGEVSLQLRVIALRYSVHPNIGLLHTYLDLDARNAHLPA